jgi:drug/metabolite transporter (DMT)-like permease
MEFLFIVLTIVFTVYGQVAIKWQINHAGEFPPDTVDKIIFLLRQLTGWGVISGFIAAFLAALSWMAAMTRFDLGFAYPFMSLSFVLILILSAVVFGETMTWNKIVGTAIILAGLFVVSR